MKDILALDVGTTAFKMGVFSPSLEKKAAATRAYSINLYGGGKADIEPEAWWTALRECCAELKEHLAEVGMIALSVTTPGLTAMADDGTALSPAILFLDGRSHRQARWIRERVGEDVLLRDACNLPVSGGSSLCSILWIKDEQPEVWAQTAKFGHCNTYLIKRLTGAWAIDPSTVSITGLYNTARNDLTYNDTVLSAAGIPRAKLPPIIQSYQTAGTVLPGVAEDLALPPGCAVLCGGNDVTLAALSGNLRNSGDIAQSCGTCEITSVCLETPIGSRDFNIRCHAIPGRWLTFRIMNTGGKALEWFHGVFCRDLTPTRFYEEYVPGVLAGFFADASRDAREARLPRYEPYLQGSRYSLEQLTAGFDGITTETTRDDLLLAVLKGNASYQADHLVEVGRRIPLGDTVMISGGGANIRGILDVKRRWMGNYKYVYQEQSSLLGAAMLGVFAQTQRWP
jgi:sugar (pentulose or hexulose) kinase